MSEKVVCTKCKKSVSASGCFMSNCPVAKKRNAVADFNQLVKSIAPASFQSEYYQEPASVPQEVMDILTPPESVIGVLYHNLTQYKVFISFMKGFVSMEEIIRFIRIEDDRDFQGRKFSKVIKLTDWWVTKYSHKCDLIERVMDFRKIENVDVNLDELMNKYSK